MALSVFCIAKAFIALAAFLLCLVSLRPEMFFTADFFLDDICLFAITSLRNLEVADMLL